eukprot:CAMPEP_0201595976 /NCGR_PEP_ID=MMETSP0190_2-20130828/192808_1 /ASSEMBLY_ACC=CAM_ASM_000263 /TAXON_ID=37353 /ORGANISM="Rosalina sp." /LENGTH=255 /DNA_ID=CAMNT_0048056155 /DNA_START=106 /DNA_END=873 /DNA_ORIENTATION=-
MDHIPDPHKDLEMSLDHVMAKEIEKPPNLSLNLGRSQSQNLNQLQTDLLKESKYNHQSRLQLLEFYLLHQRVKVHHHMIHRPSKIMVLVIQQIHIAIIYHIIIYPLQETIPHHNLPPSRNNSERSIITSPSLKNRYPSTTLNQHNTNTSPHHGPSLPKKISDSLLGKQVSIPSIGSLLRFDKSNTGTKTHSRNESGQGLINFGRAITPDHLGRDHVIVEVDEELEDDDSRTRSNEGDDEEDIPTARLAKNDSTRL